jgi:peptide deformylase
MICAIRWRKSRLETGYGRGIAAPQLGIAKRVIFLQLPGKAAWSLINPEMIKKSPETIVVWDACLSFLCIFMHVERYREITVCQRRVPGSHGFRGRRSFRITAV